MLKELVHNQIVLGFFFQVKQEHAFISKIKSSLGKN